MRIIHFYPSRGSFSPGEAATFLVDLESTISETARFCISIQHLTDRPIMVEETFQLVSDEQTVQMQWLPPANLAGYSAHLEIYTTNGSFHATTAFDVLSSWIDFPRYGFLADFNASRTAPETALKNLARFHINGLQFYDWQYRHDQLVAPAEEYSDPLGREMSLPVIRRLVDIAHQYGMAAMPYLAVYAASAEFWNAHPDWALYDEAGKPMAFGDNFLGLMDPSAGGPWSQHLLSEGVRTLDAIPFDGLHIDQYGEPKRAWNSRHEPVDIPKAFNDFIQAASDQHPKQTIVFNAVGNWPIESLVKSAVDFVYIEIWPPAVEYKHLADIVLNAVRLSQGKAVVIALYLPADQPANNLLADAVIMACGGTRIELGEDVRLLADPYFPKHEEISPQLSSELMCFADFAVRNGEWLGAYNLSAKEKAIWLEEEFIPVKDSLWVIVRRHPGVLVLSLINLAGLSSNEQWDQLHVPPAKRENVSISFQASILPRQMYWDCPEVSAASKISEFEYSDGVLTFQIPHIHYLGLVTIHE